MLELIGKGVSDGKGVLKEKVVTGVVGKKILCKEVSMSSRIRN